MFNGGECMLGFIHCCVIVHASLDIPVWMYSHLSGCGVFPRIFTSLPPPPPFRCRAGTARSCTFSRHVQVATVIVCFFFFAFFNFLDAFRCTFFVPLHSVLCDFHWLNVARFYDLCASTLLAQGAVRGSRTHEVLCNCPPPRRIHLLFICYNNLWFILLSLNAMRATSSYL